MTNTEPTVEQALAELREMFPPPLGSYQVSLYVQGDETQWRISSRSLPLIGGSTLSEAMARVRKWHGEQSSSTPDRKVRERNEH